MQPKKSPKKALSSMPTSPVAGEAPKRPLHTEVYAAAAMGKEMRNEARKMSPWTCNRGKDLAHVRVLKIVDTGT